jgi:hypothetical protein
MFNFSEFGPEAGLLSLVEVPEKAIVPFIWLRDIYTQAYLRFTWTILKKNVKSYLTKLSLDALKKNLRFTKYLDFSVF